LPRSVTENKSNLNITHMTLSENWFECIARADVDIKIPPNKNTATIIGSF